MKSLSISSNYVEKSIEKIRLIKEFDCKKMLEFDNKRNERNKSMNLYKICMKWPDGKKK